jgi:hypothetical protein
MTATEIVQILTALGTLAGVLASIFVSLRNGAKADVIKSHVNSSAAAALAKIESLQKEVTALRDVAAERKETASLLAQALVQQQPVPQTSALPVSAEATRVQP